MNACGRLRANVDRSRAWCARRIDVARVDERDRAVGRRLLLTQDGAEAVGPHARAERERHLAVAHDRARRSSRNVRSGRARRTSVETTGFFVVATVCAQPVANERGLVDIALPGRPPARGRSDPQAAAPTSRLAHDQAARKAVERRECRARRARAARRTHRGRRWSSRSAVSIATEIARAVAMFCRSTLASCRRHVRWMLIADSTPSGATIESVSATTMPRKPMRWGITASC